MIEVHVFDNTRFIEHISIFLLEELFLFQFIRYLLICQKIIGGEIGREYHL